MANAAGVSIGTASNVLNHPDRVSDDVRQRVEGAMRLLQYRRNGAASRLSKGTSGLFAVILPDVHNPFWTAMLAGAEQALADRGASLVVATAGYDPCRFEQVVHRLEQYGIDGLLVATAPTRRHLDVCRDSSLAVVVAGADGRACGVPSVSVDDRVGMRLAVDHLLDLGHRRVALVNGPGSRIWCARRRRGAVDAIVARGLDPGDSLVEVPVERMDVDHGRAVVSRIVELHDQGVTAVACANDVLAIGILGELESLGVRVPTDLSITGFDDVAAAQWATPSLTSVRQDSIAIGITAVAMLCDRIDAVAGTVPTAGTAAAPGVRPGHVVVRPELVVRASSARARRAGRATRS